MNNTEKRIEFFRRYCHFYLVARLHGIELLPYCFHRSRADQHHLYLKGLSKCDGLSKDSNHQHWLAIDAVVVNKDGSLCWDGSDDRYKTLATIAESVGLATGFEYNDANHTEWKDKV